MSYCRYGHAHKYVEGESSDYIFGNEKDEIEDYGGITNSSLVEIICDDCIEKYYKELLVD